MFADNNLFNPQWTTGNLSAIAPVVQVLGFCCMCLISFGGFFMVILPLMRNVINGIVVVAPNLCEKIDDAHATKLGLKMSGDGNQIRNLIGSFTVMVLSFFPNFKALSDFDEHGIVDPRSYMTKALFMMCIYIFCGVFVFYGYPAKFAEKFSDAATSVIDMALNNTDPDAWIAKLPTNLARPEFGTANATDQFNKNVYTASKSLYSAFTGHYSSMSKDAKIALSKRIEEEMNNQLGDINDKIAYSEKYKLKVESRILTYKPKLTEGAELPAYVTDKEDNIKITQVLGKVSDTFDTGVEGGEDGDYYMLTLKFYELAGKANTTNVSNTLRVHNSNIKSTSASGNSKSKCTWTLSASNFSVSKSGVMVNGKKGTVKVDSKTGNYTITFNGIEYSDLSKASGKTSDIWVLDGKTKGLMHSVTKITFTDSDKEKEYYCTPTDKTNWYGWNVGDSPKSKNE